MTCPLMWRRRRERQSRIARLKAEHAATLVSARDVELTRIMEVTRHRDVRTVTGYVRRANLFKGHASASFL